MGILRINVDDSVRVAAHQARLHASVKGTAAVFGNAAAKRAAEVRDLVAALAAVGLTDEAIEVTGVKLDSRSGALGRSQSVEYLLAVTATPDELPSVLGVLAERPNLKVTELEWIYDSFEASIEATSAAMAKARRKAAAIAAAAGVEIAGIAQISDSWNLPSPRIAFGAADSGVMEARAMAAPPIDLGVEISATQELFVHLTVDFELHS